MRLCRIEFSQSVSQPAACERAARSAGLEAWETSWAKAHGAHRCPWMPIGAHSCRLIGHGGVLAALQAAGGP